MPISKKLWAFVIAITSVGAAFGLAEESKKKEDRPKTEATAESMLERLKGLQGTWVALAANDHVEKGQTVLIYRPTGGGTALTETILPDTPMEMLSVYHRDGNHLVMTHYCCVGNQPRMRAKPGRDADEIVFEFTGGANLDPAKDSHIHGGLIRIVSDEKLHCEWDFYADGKLADRHVFDLGKVEEK